MACRWASLDKDALIRIAEALHAPDRHRLNLVCPAWKNNLKDAPHLWALLVLDPQHSTATPADPRLREHLPSRKALRAWVAGYGAHVRAVQLSHLSSEAEDAGCAGPTALGKAIAPVLPHLESLTLDLCAKHYVFGAARILPRIPKLASLSLNLTLENWLATWAEWQELEELLEAGLPKTLHELRLKGELLTPGSIPSDDDDDDDDDDDGDGDNNLPVQSIAWVSQLPALHTLSVRPHTNFRLALPVGLAGMAALRDLELEGPLLIDSGYQNVYRIMYHRSFAAEICALTALTRLALNDVRLGGGVVLLEEWDEFAGEEDPLRLDLFFPLPEAVTGLRALRSLSVTGHAMSSGELALLAQLTNLTSLALAVHPLYPRPPVELPAALALPWHLSALTGLRELSISHRLTRMPGFLSTLTLTKLSLHDNNITNPEPAAYSPLDRLVALPPRDEAQARCFGCIRV